VESLKFESTSELFDGNSYEITWNFPKFPETTVPCCTLQYFYWNRTVDSRSVDQQTTPRTPRNLHWKLRILNNLTAFSRNKCLELMTFTTFSKKTSNFWNQTNVLLANSLNVTEISQESSIVRLPRSFNNIQISILQWKFLGYLQEFPPGS
jgi:hypothetical protein